MPTRPSHLPTPSRRLWIVLAAAAGIGLLAYAIVRRRRRQQAAAERRLLASQPRQLYPPAPADLPPPPEPVPSRPAHRRRQLLGAALILAGLAALAYLWWNDDVTPQAPTLPTSTPVPQAITYHLDPDASQLNVEVESRIGTVKGAFALEEGTVELVPQPEGRQVIVNIKLDGESLDVGNTLVNATLRRALSLEEYPTGIYIAESQGTIPPRDGTYAIALNGQVELRGVQQRVTVESTITLSGDQITLTAQMPIDVTQFGVNVPSLLASNTLNTDLQVSGSRRDTAPDTPAETPPPGG